ncbi:MAG: SET domain-containing protein [Gammaproteobacteria bacterium]|nr:SET domain-containing protein [Gammaproteobacteria bacterium]
MNDRRESDEQLAAIVYVADSGIHGSGLFAARRIARDEYIGTFCGPPARRDGTHVLWVYDDGSDERAVGRIGRNLLRFLNHAVRCNAAFEDFDLYATRVIRRGEEITIDYGREW